MHLTRTTGSSSDQVIRPFVSDEGHRRAEPNGDGALDGPNPDDVLLDALQSDNMHLRALLATLPMIEQAKGILIAHYQTDAETAFALLRRWSSHANIKVRDIARLLVETASHLPVQAVDNEDHLPRDLRQLINTLKAFK